MIIILDPFLVIASTTAAAVVTVANYSEATLFDLNPINNKSKKPILILVQFFVTASTTVATESCLVTTLESKQQHLASGSVWIVFRKRQKFGVVSAKPFADVGLEIRGRREVEPGVAETGLSAELDQEEAGSVGRAADSLVQARRWSSETFQRMVLVGGRG